MFVLCNRFSPDPHSEDARTILRALAIKRYAIIGGCMPRSADLNAVLRRFIFRRTGQDVQTVVQLIKPENKRVFLSSAATFTKSVEHHRIRVSMRSQAVRYGVMDEPGHAGHVVND